MQTLYRKYRPQTFDEVIGQDHVGDLLKKAIHDKTFAHAYVFSGTRGTGKTSTARIFAKELGIAPEDIYEIDAASNNSVDDVRALRDAVASPPYVSDYKLYLLDEAHMLSKSAWNALLKTIEEPPAHVLFILATTEQHKIPQTILSRVEVVHFKTPQKSDLEKIVRQVAEREQYTIDDESIEHIVNSAGSYREVLGSLQQAMTASSSKQIVGDTVFEKDKTIYKEFLASALSGGNDALEILDSLRNSPEEQKNFFQNVVQTAREMLLQKVSDANIDEKNNIILNITSSHLLQLLDLYINSKKFPEPVMGLEIFVMKQKENK
jgi:DNA polymerase-3 subunit gamma/tau